MVSFCPVVSPAQAAERDKNTLGESAPGEFNPADVLAELEEEVRRLRASGAVTHAYEEELSEAFRRLVPGRSTDEELARALLVADEASYIQGEIPVESARRSVVAVKRLLRKSMAWYMNFLAAQVQEMGQANGKVSKILAARVDDLGARAPSAVPAEIIAHLGRQAVPDLSEWSELAVSLMQGCHGRIAHMEAGHGELLGTLRAAGADIYGVEPRGELADEAQAGGMDVWSDPVFDHLHAVREGALSGLILSGVVDREVPGRLWELLLLARNALSPRAPLMIISSTPAAWLSGRLGVAADLAPGRPLQAASWQVLLEAAGFSGIERREPPSHGSGDGEVDGIASKVETVAVVGVKGS